MTLITKEIVPSGLALIVYSLVSALTLLVNEIVDEIVSSSLALIVYSDVAVFTLIAEEILPAQCVWS